MEDDFDIKAVIAFLLAAKKAGESRSSDVPFEFPCAICGGQAEAVLASANGHVHAHCRHCGMNVME